jgi:hypothetical protein
LEREKKRFREAAKPREEEERNEMTRKEKIKQEKETKSRQIIRQRKKMV